MRKTLKIKFPRIFAVFITSVLLAINQGCGSKILLNIEDPIVLHTAQEFCATFVSLESEGNWSPSFVEGLLKRFASGISLGDYVEGGPVYGRICATTWEDECVGELNKELDMTQALANCRDFFFRRDNDPLTADEDFLSSDTLLDLAKTFGILPDDEETEKSINDLLAMYTGPNEAAWLAPKAESDADDAKIPFNTSMTIRVEDAANSGMILVFMPLFMDLGSINDKVLYPAKDTGFSTIESSMVGLLNIRQQSFGANYARTIRHTLTYSASSSGDGDAKLHFHFNFTLGACDPPNHQAPKMKLIPQCKTESVENLKETEIAEEFIFDPDADNDDDDDDNGGGACPAGNSQHRYRVILKDLRLQGEFADARRNKPQLYGKVCALSSEDSDLRDSANRNDIRDMLENCAELWARTSTSFLRGHVTDRRRGITGKVLDLSNLVPGGGQDDFASLRRYFPSPSAEPLGETLSINESAVIGVDDTDSEILLVFLPLAYRLTWENASPILSSSRGGEFS